MPSLFAHRVVKAILLVLVVAFVAACSRSSTTGTRGDNDPHPGVNRARTMPIQGLDLARYQGRVDFNAARADGVHFVFIKATEGKDYLDPMFYENWNGARAAGVARGVYHFMTWCSLASEQAAWFIKMVPNDPDALPPVLDLEWNNHSACKNTHNRADILEKVRVMLAAMEAHTGKLPTSTPTSTSTVKSSKASTSPTPSGSARPLPSPTTNTATVPGPSGNGPRPARCPASATRSTATSSTATSSSGPCSC